MEMIELFEEDNDGRIHLLDATTRSAEGRMMETMQDLKISIHDVDMSVRLSNILHLKGIRTLNELEEFTPLQLLEMGNFGKKSLMELRSLMADYGLSLSGDILLSKDEERKVIHEVPILMKKFTDIIWDMERELSRLRLTIECLVEDRRALEKKENECS